MKGVDVGNHVHAESVCLAFSIECKGEQSHPEVSHSGMTDLYSSLRNSDTRSLG